MRRRGWITVAGTTLLGLVAACGSTGDDVRTKAGDAADQVAELGIEVVATGRWRCETDQVEQGVTTQITTLVAIGDEGRFTWERVDGGDGPQVGTWEVDGLQLHLEVPWDDDGSNGFESWTYRADADPPGELRGRSDGGGRHDLDITIEGIDEIRLTQADDGEGGELAYAWDATCRRESSDPGPIGPTVPATG